MKVIPAFRDVTQPAEPWTADICDLIRDRWMAGIPRQFRKRKEPEYAGLEQMFAKAKAARDEVAPEIISMHRRGVSMTAIGRTVGKSCNTVRRILRENGIDPNAPAAEDAA